VTHPATLTTWFFDCRGWLDAHRGDGATLRRLDASYTNPHDLIVVPPPPVVYQAAGTETVAEQPPVPDEPPAAAPQPQEEDAAAAADAADEQQQPLQLCDYRVEVQTGEEQRAPCDARVFLQIGGDAGETGSHQLRLPVRKQPAKQRAGGGASSRLQKQRPPAAVLFGCGSLDAFVLRGLADVGRLAHVRIGHDASGTHNGWQLSWVRVTNVTTGDSALFPANNTWLDPRLPGGQSWVQLQAAADGLLEPEPNTPPTAAAEAPWQQSSSVPDSPTMPAHRGAGSPTGSPNAAAAAVAVAAKSLLLSARLGPPGYKVTFWTSPTWGAGTASRVFFELIGDEGSSGIVYVDGSGPISGGGGGSGGGGSCGGGGAFGRGGVATLLFPRLPFLGGLRQLRVGTDGKGAFAPWHLRRVEAVHVASGQRWLFDCHAWVDRRCGFQRMLTAVRGGDEYRGAQLGAASGRLVAW
jgi:hypothetical protein